MDYFARARRKLPTFSSKEKEKEKEKEEEEKVASGKSSLLLEEGLRPVPKGCLAVYVGAGEEDETTKFVIPTSYLALPAFQDLMESVAEEFGYDHEGGGIRIPCDHKAFRRTLKDLEDTLRNNEKKKKKKKKKKKPACVKKLRRDTT